MTLENKGSQPAPQESINFNELLARIGEITPEQINELKEKVIPSLQSFFDTNITEADKLILTLFSKLSDEELTALVKMEKKRGRLVGFHEVGSHLHSLSMLTNDGRYARIVHVSHDKE